MAYKVEAEPHVLRQLRQISRGDAARLWSAMKALRDEARPAGCLKLGGSGGWRVRVGDYRITYWIDDDHHVVTVTRVGHRRDLYRRR